MLLMLLCICLILFLQWMLWVFIHYNRFLPFVLTTLYTCNQHLSSKSAIFNYYLFITLFLNTVIAIQKIHHYIAAKYTKYAA